MGEAVSIDQYQEAIQPTEAMLDARVFFDRQEIEAQAQELIETRDRQPNVVVLRQEYMDNARTALMEALTASGHLSRIEISGSLEEINRQVLNRLLNGWDEALPGHEKERRFHELCEELIIQKTHAAIVAGELPAETAIAIASDCPVVRMDGIGYRYDNKKGMVRSTHLQENPGGSYTRVIEQVSRSNSGWSTTFPFLASCGVTAEAGYAPDVAALRTPVIYSQRDYVDGVVDIQRRLDHYAGKDIIYGDKKSDKPEHIAYENLRQESARREAEIENHIERLAKLEEWLNGQVKEGLSQKEAISIYQAEIHNILRVVCMLSPDYAEATFGKAAAVNYITASNMVAMGQYEQAQNFLEAQGHLERPITFCGMTLSVKEAKELGIPVSETGELIEESVASWEWKPGVCRVESCKKKTDVGPCNVCRKCQDMFDAGDDPTKRPAIKSNVSSLAEKRRQKPIASLTVKDDSTIQAAA